MQNAIPMSGFESIQPNYQFIKSLFQSVDDLTVDSEHMMIISPDEGAMTRAVYYACLLYTSLEEFKCSFRERELY